MMEELVGAPDGIERVTGQQDVTVEAGDTMAMVLSMGVVEVIVGRVGFDGDHLGGGGRG